jgi:3D (Asp-Asp-Asp) domain-containing protein
VANVSRHKKYFFKVLTGWIFTGASLLCIVLPKVVFADQSIETISQLPQSIPVITVTETELQSQESETSLPAESPDSEEHWKVVEMRVTAYCPCPKCCGEYADGITADNHRIQDGDRFVAADKRYPFGTELIIPGYNDSRPVEIKDRGGAIQGNRLDVYFDTHQQALEWGVQYLDVLIKIS